MHDDYYVDTNVFLRFLVYDTKNPKLSAQAREIFSRLQRGTLLLRTNTLIVAEIVYVLESYYELPKSRIKEILIPILSTPNLLMRNKEAALAALDLFVEKNIDFEDAYTYFDMLDENISRIITFDEKHFGRLENISVVTSSTEIGGP